MTARGRTASDEDYEPDPRRWRALAVVLVAGFMVLLDVSIVNDALPSIAAGTGAGEEALQWVVSGYALSFGLVLVAGGRIGDARGRRPTLILGLAVFTLASAACGAAQDPLMLVVARLVQGIGAGLVTPQNSGLIQGLFRGEERGRAFGLFGAVVGVSTAIGPLVGGLLIAAGGGTGWRWIFLVNVPIGIVAMVLAWRTVPHTAKADRGRTDYDPVGAVLLGVATVLILLPFVQSRSWDGPAKWGLLVPALLLGLAFVRWEKAYGRRDHEPMVNLDLFRHRSFSFGSSLGLAYFAGFTGVFFIWSQYLQEGVGYTALQAGLASSPFAVGSAVAAGLVISPNQTLTLSEVPPRQGGAAGGVLQTGQRIGSAAGIAAVGSLFYSMLPDYAGALRAGFLLIVAFIAVALAVAIADLITDRRLRRAENQAP